MMSLREGADASMVSTESEKPDQRSATISSSIPQSPWPSRGEDAMRRQSNDGTRRSA